MTEEQTHSAREGATAGDVEDEFQPTAKSAEDRKAASALASLDARGNDEPSSKEVDSEAVNKAMKSLNGSKPSAAPKPVSGKNVKIDDEDVTLLVNELELTKPKAVELLKAHDGDAVKAMRSWVEV